MKTTIAAAVLALSLTPALAGAAELKRDGPAKAMISTSVLIPPGSTILYLEGMTSAPTNAGAPAGTPPTYGDTKAQTISAFTRMAEALKAQGMGMGDVAYMHVNLVADPAKGNVIDFAGMNDAYKMFFGTPDQPNRPARTTIQVANLAGKGLLIEIEVQAAKAP